MDQICFLIQCSQQTAFKTLSFKDVAFECVEVNVTYMVTNNIKIGALRSEMSPSDCREACLSAGNCTYFSWSSNGKLDSSRCMLVEKPLSDALFLFQHHHNKKQTVD